MIPPLAGRDAPWPCRPLPSCISIHPPLAGRDINFLKTGLKIGEFQSTRPLRGGTQCRFKSDDLSEISIHPPLAGRDKKEGEEGGKEGISIHPPLAGRDSDLAQKNCAKHRILHKKCIYPGRIERFSGFDAAIFLPNVHKFRCEPSEESLLTPRSHAYTIRTPSC